MIERYQVEAGRLITRDGEGFAVVGRYQHPKSGNGPMPADVDTFTREVARNANERDALVSMVRDLRDALRSHVADEVRRLGLDADRVCPCTDGEIRKATELLARVDGAA